MEVGGRDKLWGKEGQGTEEWDQRRRGLTSGTASGSAAQRKLAARSSPLSLPTEPRQLQKQRLHPPHAQRAPPSPPYAGRWAPQRAAAPLRSAHTQHEYGRARLLRICAWPTFAKPCMNSHTSLRILQSTIIVMPGYISRSLKVSHSSCTKIIELCLEIVDSIPKPLQGIWVHSKGTLGFRLWSHHNPSHFLLSSFFLSSRKVVES